METTLAISLGDSDGGQSATHVTRSDVLAAVAAQKQSRRLTGARGAHALAMRGILSVEGGCLLNPEGGGGPPPTTIPAGPCRFTPASPYARNLMR